MSRVRIMLRRVLWRRVSRWRSFGPVAAVSITITRHQVIELLPTPTAGLTLTSMVASSGISSLRNTSIGPLTAPMMEKPLWVYVAEPSARFRWVSVTSGTAIATVYRVCVLAGLFAQCRIASSRTRPKFRWGQQGDPSSDQIAAEAPMPRCIIPDPGPAKRAYQPP